LSQPLTVVVGVGNELLQDEGVGLSLVRALGREEWPGHVRFVDGGTGGYDLVSHMEGAAHLVLLDALAGPGAPGDVHVFRPEDVVDRNPEMDASLHEARPLEVLRVAEVLGVRPPRVTVVGVVVGSIEPGLHLSPALQARWDAVLGAARAAVRAAAGAPPADAAG